MQLTYLAGIRLQKARILGVSVYAVQQHPPGNPTANRSRLIQPEVNSRDPPEHCEYPGEVALLSRSGSAVFEQPEIARSKLISQAFKLSCDTSGRQYGIDVI